MPRPSKRHPIPVSLLLVLSAACGPGEADVSSPGEAGSGIAQVNVDEGGYEHFGLEDTDLGELSQDVYVSGPYVMSHVKTFADDLCRTTGACSPSTYNGHHPSGSRALDILVSSGYGRYPSDNSALGNAAADFALRNQSKYGVWYVIFKQRINYGSGWSWMEDRGSLTNNHYDHVHVGFWSSGNLGQQTSSGSTAVTCQSGTLGRQVSKGTCVESKFDGLWYQCGSSGTWRSAPSAPSSNSGPEGACTARYFL